MIKTFRVAGLAAAAAFLCSSPAAAADQAQVNPAVQAAAATPVTSLDLNTPTISADQAVVRTLPATTADQGNTATALPGRARPDRGSADAAPAAVPNGGVMAQAQVPARRPLADLVAEHMGAENSDQQFQCLASAVYYESRGEPLEGQLAVAEVILNRVRSGRFRESICGVVTQPSQFSFVRGGAIPAAPRESAAWHRSAAIAHIAMNRLAEVTGDNSLFFHATYVSPNWGRPRIAKIGNHIFYR
jgi:hypothetical protein